MAKRVNPKFRSRTRRPSPDRAPSRSHVHARNTAALAERDMLDAVLDAAAMSQDTEKYLSQIIAYLGKYARCNCAGIVLFAADEVIACTTDHGSVPNFTRIPRGSFPGSEKCICSNMFKGQLNVQSASSTEAAFFRTSKTTASTGTEAADRLFGICVGTTFETVALIPIGTSRTVAGFIFLADERNNRIHRSSIKLLERVGGHAAATVCATLGPTGKTTTTAHDVDEMELLTRLMDSSNESMVITQDWRIIYVNNKCAEMAGMSKGDMIGLPFLDITHPDDRQEARERYSRILNGEYYSSGTVFRGLDNDGRTRWAELREIPFSWHGRPAVLSLVNDITDRKGAEEALERSERKYRQLVETLDEGVGAIDKDAKMIFVNPRMAEIFGYTVDEMVGKDLMSLLANVADETGLAEAPHKLESRRLGIKEGYEAIARRKDGTTIQLGVRSSPIFDDGGNYAGVIAAVHDITERKKAEEALRQSEAKYKNVFEHTLLGMAVVDGQTGRTVLANHSLARMFGFKSPADMIGTNPLDYVLPEDREWVVSQIAQLMADPTRVETAQIRSRTEDGRVIWLTGMGTLVEYEGRQAMLLSLVDMTATKEAETRLQESQERYRLVVDNANEGIAVLQDGILKFVNAKFANSTGYAVEDLISRSFTELIHPDDRKMAIDYYFRRLKGQDVPPLYQCRFVDKAGNTKWTEVNAVLFNWEGRTATLALLADITDRIKADEALKASEARFRKLIEESSDAIAIVDAGGRLLYETPSMERITGYKLEDWQGTPLGDWLLHPDDMAAVVSLMQRLIAHPELPNEEISVRFKHKDGTWHFLEGTVRNLLGDPNVNGLVINYRDVTERFKAGQALRESEERFRAIAENSSDLIVLLDRNAVISYESPATSPILGLSPEERIGERPFERVHPDDLPKAIEAFGELMRSPGPGPRRLNELRLQHKDGSWRTMEATGSAILRDGGVEGVVVTLHDITDRKNVEESLKASEERFRTLIEHARDVITIVDENFGVIYESPSLATVTGYTPEEWLGRSLGDMAIHPDDIPMLASEFELLKSQPGSEIEDLSVRYLHRDGSWHVIEASGRNLLHDARVKGIVVNFRDVTVRRRMEEALRESELRYRLLAENASDVIFTSDTDMKLTYVSPSVVTLTGYTAEETISRPFDDWMTPESRELVLTVLASTVAKAKSGTDMPPVSRTATLEMRKKDGGTVWVEIKVDFIRDAEGALAGLLGVARDITDRRIAEMELERRAQLEMLITQISTAFIGVSTDQMDEGIQNALESISLFCNVDRSYIFMLNEDKTSMSMMHEWCDRGIEPLIGGLDSLQVSSLPFLVDKVKAMECIHIPDLAVLPAAASAEKALLQRQGIRSVLVVPIAQSGNAIGFFGLSSIRNKKTWDEETISLLRLVGEMFSNATERKRMDLALRESEKRYRLLAENIIDVIWTTDMGLRVTYVSPSGARLVGFSQKEYLNMTLEDMLTPASFREGLRVFAEQQAIFTQRRDTEPFHWTLDVELRCKDGSTVWAEERVSFIQDESGQPVGILGVTRDIRERRSVEEALRRSEEKYRTLVEASPDGVLSIDGRGIVTDSNTGLCRMLGYEKEQLRGKEARLLGTRKDLDAEPYYSSHLAQGDSLEVETEILRRDGQPLPVWAKLVRLAEPRTADIHTIIYFRDIADRRKIDEMKDEFVGLVSHELRSPLTVIIGALHTAMSEGPRLSQKETRQLLEDAALEAEQLSHLVGNLLELSRAQANRLFLHVEPVNMAKAIHKVIGSIERQSSKHKFVVDLPKRLPQVSADQLRLERILYNLLENSVKNSPEGSEITVSATRDAGQLVVSVTDRGTGISKEDQAKLFKPFQQLGDPMLDHTKGAGLGLLVCRRLVEAHGGHIWVESEPGQGASFRFTLEAGTKNTVDAD